METKAHKRRDKQARNKCDPLLKVIHDPLVKEHLDRVANELVYEVMSSRLDVICDAVLSSFSELNNFFNIEDRRQELLNEIMALKNAG